MRGIYQPSGEAGEYSRWAVNLYDGCGHGCGYCYVPSILRMDAAVWASRIGKRREGILRQLERDVVKLARMEPGADVLMCFTSDPYGPGETSTTREAIRILGEAGLRPVILTKSGGRAVRDFDLLLEHGGSFGTSLVWSTSDAKRIEWEPYAASVDERMLVIAQAKNYGLHTWVSLEPVIDPVEALGVIEMMHGLVDHWKVGKINAKGRWAPEVMEKVKRIERETDWRAFAVDVLQLLTKLNANFYMKNSLSKYLHERAPR